jgi:hypothetical protein
MIASVMQSEYTAKYNSKPDNTTVNNALLVSASAMQRKEQLSGQGNTRVAASIMAKMLNAVNGSIIYPLCITSSYLLGHGNSWFPLDTCAYDWTTFQKRLLAKNNTSSAAEHEDETNYQMLRGDGSKVHVVGPVSQYECRHTCLDSWSPFALAMAFTFVKAGGKGWTKKARELVLTDAFPHKAGHNPRTSNCIPQFFRDPPMYPDDSSPSDVKETWAAYALGNFCPYDRYVTYAMHHTNWSPIM